MNIEELDHIHSELAALTSKRISDIAQYGAPLRLANSEKSYQAIVTDDLKSAMFEHATPLLHGQEFEGKGYTLVVLAFEVKAGCKVALTAPVIGTAAVMEKQEAQGQQGASVRLAQTSTRLPILKHEGNYLTVPRRFAGLTGRVLKTGSGELLEVVSGVIRGATAELRVQPYQAPQAKSFSPKQGPPQWVTNPPQADTWHSGYVR
ncbi:hypothetical protein GMSM_45980 [Geomonas sp. Red276]